VWTCSKSGTHLRRLRKHGLLLQQGKGAETYYVPTEKLLGPWRDYAANVGNSEPKPGNLPPKPGNLPFKSGQFDPKSGNLPEDLQREINALGRKVSQDKMEELVIRLCRWQPLSKEELAAYLSRNANYVQANLITPLLRSGRLLMTVPDQLNHPQQKYRPV
jgi:ATP-dependent DNA helicase RecG